MSVLTVHMWSSRSDSLDEPDWFVFDLDPAKGKGIEQAIEAAILIRGLLENLQLPSVPKTSGKRGIHVFIPLAKGYSHERSSASTRIPPHGLDSHRRRNRPVSLDEGSQSESNSSTY